MRRYIVVLLMLGLIFIPGVYAQETDETIIELGDTVEDQLEDDMMEFVFEGERGDVLQISLSSRDFDTLLVVLNEEDEEVARDDDSGPDTNSLLNFTVPANGSYTIRVSSYSGSATGDFVLRLTQQKITHEIIEIGDTVEGQLEENLMNFTFEGEQGDFLQVSLSSPDFDTLLVIVNDISEEVARDDDSGSDTNSLLSFNVPENGKYTIRVSSYSGEATGSFVLRLKRQEITPLTLGEPLNVQLHGSDIHYFTFEGSEGQAVNISADSNGRLDTVLTLKQEGIEIARDDDTGEGLDPYIRQTILPADGMYVIELSPLGGNELNGKVTLFLEEAEILSLDDEVTQTITFNSDSAYEALQFTAVEGADYLLNVESSSSVIFSLEVYVGGTQMSYVNTSTTTRIAFAFKPETSGVGIVRVNPTVYDRGDVEVQVTLERLAR
jgi:hypothetical protein